MGQLKPVDAAQWLLVGIGLYFVSKVGKTLDNVFGGLAADSEKGSLPPLPGTSFPRQQYFLMAERIYSAIWTSPYTEDEFSVMRVLAELRNTADLVALFNAYGIRRGPNIIDMSGNLYATIRHYFSADEIAAVNRHFARKGIQAAF